MNKKPFAPYLTVNRCTLDRPYFIYAMKLMSSRKELHTEATATATNQNRNYLFAHDLIGIWRIGRSASSRTIENTLTV